MRLAVARVRGVPPAAGVIVTAVGLLIVDLVRGGGTSKYPPVVLIVLLLGLGAVRMARRWPWLVAATLLVVVLIPSDGRYTFAGHLPVQMEPYRIVVGLMIVGWLVALLVDPRVRARTSKLEGPLILIVAATLGSEAVNLARVGDVSTYVIKAIWLFACLIVFFYLVVSVIRTRAIVERLLTILVSAGCIEALGAIYERRSGDDIFNRLHFVLPGFTFNGGTVLSGLSRGGAVRATASAGHPIELSSTMAMLIPLAVYLAISRGQKRWWLAVLVLAGGDFAGGSRTGIIGIAVIVAIFVWLRPRQTLRCWPALFPALIVMHFVSPGSLGGLSAAFFPSGGLLKQQTQTFVGRGGVTQDSTRLSRLGPSLHEFSEYNPLFGEGYGTRITGNGPTGVPNPDDNAQVLDDQWLKTLLETGILGFLGWIWLFARTIRRLGARARLERGTPQGWLPVALAGSIAAFASSMLTYDAFSFTQATFVMFILVALATVILLLPPVKRRSRAPGGAEAIARLRAVADTGRMASPNADQALV